MQRDHCKLNKSQFPRYEVRKVKTLNSVHKKTDVVRPFFLENGTVHFFPEQKKGAFFKKAVGIIAVCTRT